MSNTVKSQPFDLRLGDDVKIITPGDESTVPGRVAMAAAPVYEIKMDDDVELTVGTPVRCEPVNCPRHSRIMASVVGHKKGETKLWITAMEIKVGTERAKRFPVKGVKALVSPEVGTVDLHDVSTSGLSFTCGVRVFPGDQLTLDIDSGVSPLKVAVEVAHTTQAVGSAEVVVGCRLTSKTDDWADFVRRIQTTQFAKAG
ncbi:MAG: hypothetical protein KF857_00895 [Fimbriimonadaceae bacterium]|nr:hypothetical protein [Fimbriimonadaceae bacterium]